MRHFRIVCCAATAWAVVFAAESIEAVTDYIWFSVNGDTTATSMIQGDTLGWGSNCAVGATVRWSVWIDLNANNTLDTLVDRIIADFDITDGETVSNDGPPDTNPVPDGWIVTPPMALGVAPAYYFFKAIDLTDDTFASRGLNVDPLPSPPNRFTGTVTVPGYPPPDPFLAYRWIEASEEGPGGNFWSGLSDTTGAYEINVGASGTGVLFRIGVPDLPGFVTPASVPRVASGVITGIDFSYELPADSLYGRLENTAGSPILTSQEVWARPRAGGDVYRRSSTSSGKYAIYLIPSDVGEWDAGVEWGGLIPTYLAPDNLHFRYGGTGSIEHNFVCHTTDTVIYVKVTELGAPPANSYRFSARSQDNLGSTFAVSGPGAGNVVPLHISSLGALWDVYLDRWDDRYPIPAGLALEAGSGGSGGPGDTVFFNFVSGHMVRDTIKVDPGDPLPVWRNAWVYMSGSGISYNATPDNNGVFTLYVDTGNYSLSANAPGYLSTPDRRDMRITGDTTGGMGFTLNYRHALIRGTVSGQALTLQQGLPIWAQSGTWPNGYNVGTSVDSATGNYALSVCEGDWTVYPPFIPGYQPPDPVVVSIGDSPDTVTQDFYYSVVVAVGDDGTVPEAFELRQNFPNPFNPETEIGFSLPLAADVKLEIFNIAGRRVAAPVDGRLEAGRHSVRWDGSRFPSGLYLYRLKAGPFVSTRKMLLMK